MLVEQAKIEQQIFDLRGLSQLSGVPVPTLRDYIKKEGLPCFKVRGKVLIKRSEFEDWLEHYRVENRLDEIVSDVLASLKSDR